MRHDPHDVNAKMGRTNGGLVVESKVREKLALVCYYMGYSRVASLEFRQSNWLLLCSARRDTSLTLSRPIPYLLTTPELICVTF